MGVCDPAALLTQALAHYSLRAGGDVKADISLLPLAWIQLARSALIDGAARRTPSQLVILININVNNTQTACWRTNKHVNNASTHSDVLDGVESGEEGEERHIYHLRAQSVKQGC